MTMKVNKLILATLFNNFNILLNIILKPEQKFICDAALQDVLTAGLDIWPIALCLHGTLSSKE